MANDVKFLQILDWDSPRQNALLRDELAAGLQQPQARIAPKFFYDALGSRLFEAITELPEYYLTRVEAAIFRDRMPDIRQALGTDFSLIDLGCGSCAKAGRLFHAGILPRRYVAIDISVEFLRDSLHHLKREFPSIDMLGLGLDFTDELHLPDELPPERRVFFYPGSSIGNFGPAEASRFLRGLAARLDGTGGLLIGVDLAKDKALLDAAYDDPLGVTAAFNLNILRHVNARLAADFAIGDWRHVAFYDPGPGRIEMHLEARRPIEVRWSGTNGPISRSFAGGERIHTENSWKYSAEGFATLLTGAGFTDIQVWTDPNRWFALFFARRAG